jgi:hypothetical protein
MHAKGSGAYGTFTVTHDITKYTRAKIFCLLDVRSGIDRVPGSVEAIPRVVDLSQP